MFISGTYGTCCTFLILLGPTQTPYGCIWFGCSSSCCCRSNNVMITTVDLVVVKSPDQILVRNTTTIFHSTIELGRSRFSELGAVFKNGFQF